MDKRTGFVQQLHFIVTIKDMKNDEFCTYLP